MSSTDHCAASRLTRCMGAASLVIEPHPYTAGKMRVFLEDGSSQRKSANLKLTPDVAAELHSEASSQFFGTPSDANDWLLDRATELTCQSYSSRSAA